MYNFFKDTELESQNKFMLVNLLFKRIKQLSITPLDSPEAKPSPQEIISKAYLEVEDGKVKGLVKEVKGIFIKKDLKEVPILNTPKDHYQGKHPKVIRENRKQEQFSF